MASPDLSIIFALLRSLLLLLLLCAYGGQVHANDHGVGVVRVESLMPAIVCSTPKAQDRNSLKIVHRQGPCSPHIGSKPNHLQTLSQDSIRVASLQARLSSTSGGNATAPLPQGSMVSVPARRGTSFGTGNYVVTLGFGTPKTDQTVELDTGSNVCWIQCRPCVGSCYKQQEPVFDPSASSSYRNISCTSVACRILARSGCSGGTCLYSVLYGDNSSTVGFLAVEQLTLTPTHVFQNFVFGCGEINKGLFGQAAGLMGLGRSPFSLVSQTASKLGKVFSYCLPQTSSTTGHLTLGQTSVPSAVYTPMLNDSRAPTLYFIDLIGITVGGTRLPVPPTVFRTVGTIIDSGTVITRLPSSAYSALQSAFRSAMSEYPLTKPAGILDTCYDFSNVQTVSYPKITLHYYGVDVQLGAAGVFFVIDASQVCLAFAGNSDPGDVGIIGNVQQRTFQVIYDIGAEKIGFAAGTCG